MTPSEPEPSTPLSSDASAAPPPSAAEVGPQAAAPHDVPKPEDRPRRRFKHHAWYIGLATLVVLLIALRLALPSIVKRYVNKTLSQLDGMDGSVEDIDISLWRGAYQIEGLRLDKTGGKVPVPFLEASLIDLSVQWEALIHGKIVAEIELYDPKLNFVVSKAPAKSQTKVGPNWTDTVRDLVPIDINRVAIYGGQVHYRDLESKPRVDVFVQQIDATLHNLTNSNDEGADLYASFEASALAMGSGRIQFKGKLNPYAPKPTFSFVFNLEKLELKQLNAFLQAYANVDAEQGTLSLDAEVEAAHGRFKGYVKPFIKNLKVLSWDNEKENFFDKLWEGVVQVAAEVLKNHKHDQIATKVPLRGSTEAPSADTLATMFGLLKNAFLQALRRGIEGELNGHALETQ
jgi:hypothetical protein